MCTLVAVHSQDSLAADTEEEALDMDVVGILLNIASSSMDSILLAHLGYYCC